MRYPVMNLGAVLNTVPRGLSDGQIDKICDLVETANEATSERDRNESANTIRSWMDSLPGSLQDPASDKGTLKRYIDRFCKNGKEFLLRYQPGVPVGVPTPTPPKYERPPVATPPLKPPVPPGKPVASPPSYGPKPQDRKPVYTPSTLPTNIPQNILDAICQAIKAFIEDPQNSSMYGDVIKKMISQYATTAEAQTALQRYMDRNCDPNIPWDQIWQYGSYAPGKSVPSYEPGLTPTPSKRKPQPTPTKPKPTPTPIPTETPATKRPDVPTLPTVPLQDTATASANPYDLTPRFQEQSNQYNLTPPSMRPDVATGQCPPDAQGRPQFYDGRQCRGSVVPGAAGLVNQAMNLGPSGANMPGGGMMPGGYSSGGAPPAYSMGRRYPVVNL